MTSFFAEPLVQEILSIALLVWGVIWTLLAMWKAAKKSHWIWFILIFIAWAIGNISLVFAIIGYFGLLAILYFYIFSRFSLKNNVLTFEKWGKKKDKAPKEKKK